MKTHEMGRADVARILEQPDESDRTTDEAGHPPHSPALRQKVLPFMVSLLLHAVVIVLGVVTVHVVRTAAAVQTHVQVIVPDMGPMTDEVTGGGKAPGLPASGASSAAAQELPAITEMSDPGAGRGHDLGGGLDAGDNTADIGFASTIHPGNGSTRGGVGGNGDGNSGISPFGVPGGTGGGGALCAFVGCPAYARKIVFVCDATGSMMKNFDLLRVQLRRSVDTLRPPQSFNVLFFQENAKPPISNQLIFATPESKRRAFEFVDTYAARGPTDPMPSLKLALQMKPELIYFLIDPSDFPDKTAVLELFRRENADKRIKLNAIAFIEHNADDEAFLKQLATENGGVFHYVSEDDLVR